MQKKFFKPKCKDILQIEMMELQNTSGLQSS